MQNALDLAIKRHECGSVKGHYTANNGKNYPAYMDNDRWIAFREWMKNNRRLAFQEFGAGAGGELKDTGLLPPKMASYGSSSRMIFRLAKDISDFHFEHKMSTVVGGEAHLDGFMETEEKKVFVEAKCRELYGAKSPNVDTKYREVYRYIDADAGCNLHIRTVNTGEKMKVTFTAGGTEVSAFDMKQMICHLLGIAADCLRHPTDKALSFIYLCYDPTSLAIENASRAKAICNRYQQWQREYDSVDFPALFGVILRYLKHELQIGRATDEEVATMTAHFRIVRCNQHDFEQVCLK